MTRMSDLNIIFYTAPSDYSSASGNIDMTDSNTVQCVPIKIISDSTTEYFDECFTYTISTTVSVAGVTLSPTTATICISGEVDGKVHSVHFIDQYLLQIFPTVCKYIWSGGVILHH